MAPLLLKLLLARENQSRKIHLAVQSLAWSLTAPMWLTLS